MKQQFLASVIATLLLGPSLAVAAAPPTVVFNADLEQRLDHLEVVALRDPAEALRGLPPLAEAPEARGRGVRLRFAEGRVRMQAGDVPGALRMAALLEADPAGKAPAEALRGALAERQQQLGEAAQHANNVLHELGKSCDLDESAELPQLPKSCDASSALIALALLQQDQYNRGLLPKATEYAQRRLALARAAEREIDIVQTMGDYALLEFARDHTAEAQQWVQRTRVQAGEDPLLLAIAKTYEANLSARSGNKPAQARAQMEGLAYARQAGLSSWVARAQSNLADYYMQEHEPERALVLLHEALPVFQRLQDLSRERTARHNLAVTLIRLKRFPLARREMARVEELRRDQPDITRRMAELRELDQAWTDVGQPREALTLFHEERRLFEEANQRNRDALLSELKVKYDSAAKERDLDLLMRDKSLKDRQLDNRTLLREIGVAVGVLLCLATLLGVVMVRKARTAQKALKAKEALLRMQSERDPLTELANRRHFLAVMESLPQDEFNGALLMVDIDHFKHVNDEHGHASGDVVICEVARRLSHAVRAGDLVVRWGGEEFLIFAPVSSNEQLETLAERILHNIASVPVAAPDGPLRVTASIGFGRFPMAAKAEGRLSLHWEQAVNWVDLVLYSAKARGRNRAIGITSVALDAHDTAGVAKLEADFDASLSRGLVTLREVIGPGPQ